MIDPTTARAPANVTSLLLELLLTEVRETAQPDEELAFLHSVGFQLAARYPLQSSGSLEAVEAELNDLFQHLGLGTVRLSVTKDGIHIRHRLLPVDGLEQDGAWRGALPRILQGAYDAWLRSLGSGPKLHTTIVSSDGFTFEFRHGA
ncbi:hypothetical protein PX554_15820 [Sphingomonas sp. H39-1-10]|uniref:cellulose biosynthesis protein BcsD n=1 Tax=Sphingomonas TaxID=13687 RepID=UPI000881DB58|nr:MULTISPECIES: hypothetical protein [Sphingomonas]MDF0489602.1 hypothetical protein [Sphingomonas pollutisoli]SDA28281.1 hypothetical protein SAMN03159340_02184 [Sphingomonas sp. NFR15]